MTRFQVIRRNPLWLALLALIAVCSVCSVAQEPIDMQRAKELNRKRQAGWTLTAEEQAYLRRAMELRKGQKPDRGKPTQRPADPRAGSERPSTQAPALAEDVYGPSADIPVTFTLEAPGHLTVVVEDADGKRVHNLVADTYFPAGRHALHWDGYDVGTGLNAQRNQGKERFGLTNDLQRTRVKPGTYQLRGLVHNGVRLRYEMSVQSPGRPPWHTQDGSGAWFTDHSYPIAALFLPGGSAWGKAPQVLLTASIAETGHACIWVTLDGRKLFGKQLGGMMGALAAARDVGTKPLRTYDHYTLGSFRSVQQIVGHSPDGAHKTVMVIPDGLLGKSLVVNAAKGKKGLSRSGIGLAVYNGTAVLSLPEDDHVLFLDLGAKTGNGRRAPVPHPTGVLIDAKGRLIVLSGKQLKRFEVDWVAGKLGKAETLVSQHLEAPYDLAGDAEGNFYVSDRGASHQVKVFASDGRLVRTIGKIGGQQIGPYDEQKMNNPAGIAVDSKGTLWVAEAAYAPKRVSLWSIEDGRFLRALYGSPKYGGGGVIDPMDKSRFYYSGNSGHLGIEFELDWATGESRPKSIYSLAEMEPEGKLLIGRRGPEQPIYVGGRLYLTNCFAAGPRGPDNMAGIWLMEDNGRIRPVVAGGFVSKWDVFQREDVTAAIEKVGASAKGLFFIWTDVNGDGKAQAGEFQFKQAPRGPDSIHATSKLGFASGNGLLIVPSWIDSTGLPHYDIESMRYVTEDVSVTRSRPVVGSDGWVVLAGGPICGFKDGKLRWSYPCRFPERGGPPLPTRRGQTMGLSRLMTYPMTPKAGQAGQLWAVAGDKGVIYLMTMDGLFVAELGGDSRTTAWLRSKQWERGMVLERISFREEHFWPTMTQTADGSVYLCAGKEHTSIFKVDGLETVRRKDFGRVKVSEKMLAGKKPSYVVRSRVTVEKSMTVAIRPTAPEVDGQLDDWPEESWRPLPQDVRAAVCVSGDTLYAAFRVGDPRRLANTASAGWREIFATGGGLDVMVRSRPGAKAAGKEYRHQRQLTAVEGDVRVFITREGDPKTGPWRAVRFQQIGGPGPAAEYVSPIRQLKLDSATDATAKVNVAQSGGDYEVAIPLAVLGITPTDGMATKGDIGVLLGSGGETRARLYWGAGGAGMVSDVPTEAELLPHTWATWVFRRKGKD